MNQETLLNDIDALFFDFDGVLTTNQVHIDQDGKEFVSCSRADGLAFDLLHKLKKSTYIISTEQNPVVTARANKLNIPVIQGVKNKVEAICELSIKENLNLSKVIYTGNDINDYRAMQVCGYAACPADSHKEIKRIATFILKADGGKGVVRELLEDVFKVDLLQMLYPK